MDDLKQKIVLQNLIANTNHTLICAFAFYNFIFPDCDEPYPF